MNYITLDIYLDILYLYTLTFLLVRNNVKIDIFMTDDK